jgi:putative transposase
MVTVTSRLSSVENVYYYFRVWRNDRVWEQINAVLHSEMRIAYGREPDPSAAILDSQFLKQHKHLEFAVLMPPGK